MIQAKSHLAAWWALAAWRGHQPLIVGLGARCEHSVLDMLRGIDKAGSKTLPCKIGARCLGDIAECYADPSLAVVNWCLKFRLPQ